MKKHCEEGKILCEQFEDKLKDWGFAEVNREAADRIVGGCANPNLKEFSKHAKEAEGALLKAKQVYVVHVADCLVCSRKLVAPPNAVSTSDVTSDGHRNGGTAG